MPCLVMVDERRLQWEALAAAREITLVWPVVAMEALDVVLQRVHPCEELVTHRAVHLRTVRVVDLQVTLESVLAVKRLATRRADVLPRQAVSCLSIHIDLIVQAAPFSVKPVFVFVIGAPHRSIVREGCDRVTVATGHAQQDVLGRGDALGGVWEVGSEGGRGGVY